VIAAIAADLRLAGAHGSEPQFLAPPSPPAAAQEARLDLPNRELALLGPCAISNWCWFRFTTSCCTDGQRRFV